MADTEFSCEETAEELRKRYRYRQMILSGKLKLPHQRAAQLLGPDCLYHLYSLDEKGGKSRSRIKPAKVKIRK
jgi:hypothetical protein